MAGARLDGWIREVVFEEAGSVSLGLAGLVVDRMPQPPETEARRSSAQAPSGATTKFGVTRKFLDGPAVGCTSDLPKVIFFVMHSYIVLHKPLLADMAIRPV
jgi:hypothetical protein